MYDDFGTRDRSPDEWRREAEAWHEIERRLSRLWREVAVDDVRGVAAVLRAVGGIDRVVQVICLDQVHIFVDASGINMRFVAVLGAAEPGGSAPIHGVNVEVVALADDLDRHRFAHRVVLPDRRDL